MSWSRVTLAAFGLIFLELFLTKRGAAANVGGAETGATKLLQKFLDPSVPAFASSSGSTSSSSAPASSSVPSSTSTAPTPAPAQTSAYSPSTTPPADYLVGVA